MPAMKKSVLVLISLATMAFQSANAGSAVAMEPRHGNMATAYGGPVSREEQRALANGRRLYGSNVRIIAATDVAGYCAVGVAARVGSTVIVGVALGQKSTNDAKAIVFAQLRKAGGVKPKIISIWHDSSRSTASN